MTPRAHHRLRARLADSLFGAADWCAAASWRPHPPPLDADGHSKWCRTCAAFHALDAASCHLDNLAARIDPQEAKP